MEREYNPSLIYQLKNDHKELFNIYEELYNLFVNNSIYKTIVDKLIQLKIKLDMNIDFEQSFSHNPLYTL